MSIVNLVGQFLKEQGFNETFDTLEREYGQPINTNVNQLPNQETLSDIVKDRFNFKALEQAVDEIEKFDFNPWKSPWPKSLHKDLNINEVIVSVAVSKPHKWVLLSTATQKIIVVSYTGEIINVYNQLIGRVVAKKIVCGGENDVFFAGMNGMLYHFVVDGEELKKVNDMSVHRRLIIDMKYLEMDKNPVLVTVGFDKTIKLIDVNKWEISASFELLQIPHCFDAINFNGKTMALVGYNESTILDFLHIHPNSIDRLHRISINDAEFITSNFSPRFIEFKPYKDQLLAAVGTSHEPYMRVIILPITFEVHDGIKRNQIVKNVLTMSPQDKFSTPVINWRKDGSGIWVLGDDGKVRGINLKNDSLVEIEGHEGKIKHIMTYDHDGEVILTIGDDKKMRVWK